MRSIEELYQYLCELAPLELQMGFDNAGFLIGRSAAPVSRALLALDITDEVIDEAAEKGCELIISHHPLIFHKLRSVTDREPDARVLHILEKGIGAICMHTNLDIADGGVNDVLLALLGASREGSLDAEGCGRYGALPESAALSDFLALVKQRLNAKGLRYYDAGKRVRRLAVMGGAGGDSLRDAWEKGCDTYVTADLKYHQFQDAALYGINLIDADHFSTENPVMPVLCARLRERFPDVSFQLSERHRAIISFF